VIVLVVSPSDDYHTACVKYELEQRGNTVFVADVTELSHGAELAFSPHQPDAAEWRRTDGSAIRIATADVVWFRRFFPTVPPATVTDASDRRFIMREWNQLVLGAFDSISARFVDAPTATGSATKPRQLALAHRAGLRVPATLITSSATRAKEFVASHDNRVIHKTLTAPMDAFFETKLWGTDEESVVDDLAIAPTILQEYIEGELEVRVTIVGEQIFAASYRPASLDGRLDGIAPYTAHTLPLAVEAGLHQIMRELSLTYATGDIRITSNGEYVFLELNPQGQYLWIEIQTGQPITHAMAEFLARPQPATRAPST
jgi:hypothetical protein